MRSIFITLSALAISVLATPQPEAAAAAIAADTKAVAVKERAALADGPILDDIIEAAALEKRTPNFSPFNSIKNGLFARDCTGTCNCEKGLDPGLYCGYCTSPHNAVVSCTDKNEGGCFDKVYQCSSSGKCCTYGKRGSCAQRKGPCNGED